MDEQEYRKAVLQKLDALCGMTFMGFLVVILIMSGVFK